MNNPNEPNQTTDQNETNQNNIIKNEELSNSNSNQIIENGHQNANNNINEEEKNNEDNHSDDEKKDELLKKKEQDTIKLWKAQKQAQLQMMEKQYDDFFNNIINKWETDKNNFEQFFEEQVLKNINNIVSLPCIVLFQEKIILSFKFLCKYFSFLKDNLKEMPINVIHQACYIHNNNIFYKYPNLNNINNQIDSQHFDLIGDKIFYQIFKELLPNDEIENPQFNLSYNCMIKYFFEYLFHIGYNKKYITDFLSRDEFDFQNYLYFCDYSFFNLICCDDNFIRKNDYNILIIRNFIQKMNYFLEHSQEYIKENKNLYLQNINTLVNNYFNKIFGALTRMLDIFEQQNLENEIENFCFCFYKPIEILLKQQKLELRINGINHLSALTNLYKNNNAKNLKIYYNDHERVLEYTKNKLIKFIQNINIFDLIFGENIHEAIIERCYCVLSFLYKNKCFPPEKISFLWKMSQSKYQSINNSIIGLIGKLLPEFSNEDCNNILQTVYNMNYNEVNDITFKLLENFFISEQRNENLLNILYKYSNELSYYEGLSSTIINKSRNTLLKLLFNKKYVNDLHQCLKNCLFCLDNNYLLNTHRTIFIEIMNQFINNNKNDNIIEIFQLFNENIHNFSNFISFMDLKYSMYNILINNLLFMKKIFIFFTEEGIRLKHLINEGNFDFESLLNIDALLLKYKEYEQKNNFNDDEFKMDIESENIINTKDNKIENNSNYYLLPKKKSDIEKYLKLIMDDFICYFKNKLLKEKISLTDEEIVNNIFTQFEFSFEKKNYKKVITQIIEFIFKSHQVGSIHIKRSMIDILYKLLVENAIFKEENEIFFNYIKNSLNLENNNCNLNIISDEDIEYLCLDKICSNEIINLPFSAYEIINKYIIFKNEKNGNIDYSHSSNKYIDIKRVDLFFGLKTFLEFYVNTKNPKIFTNTFSTLTNILEIAASDLLKRRYILDELFKLLDNFKIKIKEEEKNNVEKIAFRRILRLISIINKTKVSKNLYDRNDPNNMLNLNIINNFFFKNNDETLSFNAFKGLTIGELKNELINYLICNNQNNLSLFNNLMNYPHPDISNLDELKNEIKRNNLIILFYNSQVLKEDFTLADYNINSNENIIILNRIDADLNGQDFQMSDAELKEGYQQIKVVFEDKYSEEIMKEALYKEKGDIQNAIVYMTNQENITNLLNEIEKKKKNEPKKREEFICLEENKFNILLDILNEGDADLNSSVWDLFSEIKFRDIFIMNCIGNDFDKIFEEKNINKKILILKIINSVIFDDETFCKNNKLYKHIKDQWMFKFLHNDTFIIHILDLLSKIKIDDNNQISYFQIINIIINWFSKIIKKITEIKNKNNINNNNNKIDDSGSNFNIIIDNEESKQNENENENNNKEIYGEFDILENEAIYLLEILTKNNFVSLIYNILGVVLDFTKSSIKVEQKKLINNIYDILLEYLGLKPQDIIKLLEEEKKSKKIENILMISKEKDIKKYTFNFIKNLMENVKNNNGNDNENNIDIQSILLNCYYPELISDEIYEEEYYELYNYLINFETIKPNVIPIDKITEKFLNDLYNFYMYIKNNNNDEKYEKMKSKMQYNLYILSCFNPFYREILENEIDKKLKENKDIITLLYNSLFEIKNENNNLEYSFLPEKLRSNAFNLLAIIISLDKKYYDKISLKIINQHKEIVQKINGLPLHFPMRDFNTEKFIGLKNFGATCYLNSLFQQMFMIPTFQQDLFSFNIINKNENLNNNENENEDLKYSTIYNMQLAFTNLKKTCMPFYPPIKFIKSFKSAFNGQPINIGIQQDTDEFLAILCDELEKEAKKFGKENFLENSFKGKITNEIVSLEKQYPYYSQTEEPFYRITLDIKGHNNLEDALDAYIKGEILDGDNKYFVEKYNQKISIKKRTSIKKIGNQIIIHLKRFEFDFITFQNNKLNDYLKFPLKLNFKKWTRVFIRTNEVNNDENNENNIISEEEKENLNDEKMNYELTGILIHSGASLQSGHYYSFIKDQETNKWYKFNDSKISEYDIDNDLEKECFGNINSKKNQYGKGAYLLFYTKKGCVDSYKNYEKNIKIDENILKEVEKENIEFIKLKTYEDESYKTFLINFIKYSLNYLKDKEISFPKDKYYIKLMNKDIIREMKIYDKLISLLKGNKENNIDLNEEEIKALPENIEEIYEKCKTEILYLEKDEKKNNKIINNENLTTKNIIKLLYYFTFGIILQYNDKDQKLNELLNVLIEFLRNKPNYSFWILKSMEKNINLFIDLLFKFYFVDKDMTGINRTISNLYSVIFDSVYHFEKNNFGLITNDKFHQFVKDEKGKLKIEKEYKSLFLRMFKKIFCENLEKCRKEYFKENLFLDIFYNIIYAYPEASLVSSNYLLTLASLVTNNNIEMFKSVKNPNFKMGNNNNYQPNIIYLKTFCNTILRCVTPGMIVSKQRSLYFTSPHNYNYDNPDFSLYPKLPENWDKYLEAYFLNYALLNPSDELSKVLIHTSYNDKNISYLIMNFINKTLKNQIVYYTNIELVVLKASEMCESNDDLNGFRLQTLFELDKNDPNEETLIDFYIRIKEQSPFIVIQGIYSFGKAISRYQIIYKYFVNNKNKIAWVKDYYAFILANLGDKNSGFYKNIEKILEKYQNILQVIENEFINKLGI